MMLSTYRLQLTEHFTLAHAREVVPYLERLGVTHLYLSPVLQARAGSTHGYDVADPTKVSATLGGEEALRALADAAHARGMGIVLDIVPNHMGTGPDNPFWEELLTHGERAHYARWFDVDWAAHSARKIVLPVLGDELDAVLARGELGLDIHEQRGIRLKYFDHTFPLDPATIPEQLQLVQLDPHARDAAVAWVSGDEGRANMRRLLDAQHYALTFWRHAPTGINYRRFFDINELAALRVEDPPVFDETHALVLRLVEEGVLDGLRIDHVDGLRDPLGYLQRLRAEVDRRVEGGGKREAGRGNSEGGALGAANPDVPFPHPPSPFPIFVEKILSPGERLRRGWPVQGTTGYEFLNDLEALFIDADGARTLERSYRTLRRLPQRGEPNEFEDVAREGKLLVLRGALRSDMLRLARRLADAEERGPGRATRDDVRFLADALSQLVASLPVYRTYIDGRTVLPHEDDRRVLERAVARVKAHLGEGEHGVVARVARAFLSPLEPDAPMRAERLAFLLRFQQTSGPATAKGVEDTALYRYVPLASRNEVGGEPDRPLHDAVARLHEANAERAAHWPLALTAVNTHDTKRSADLRARVDVLSELPAEWQRHAMRWRRLNRRHRTVVKGRLIPDTPTEWLLYQTLVGLWPAPRTGRRADDPPDAAWLGQAAGRLREYMLKAVKEAKLLTSWTDPDPAYEEAVGRFIDAILVPATSAGTESTFLGDVSRFVARVSRAGLWNALARVVVHGTAPGTPDTYQGDECWAFALVDPDNRRPVDFGGHAALLAELEGIFPPGLDPADAAARLRDIGHAPEDGRLKLFVAWRTLQARRAAPDCFTGGYRPLDAQGPQAARLFAFARTSATSDARAAITVVPRLQVPLGLAGHGCTVPSDAWTATTIALPPELAHGRWRSAFTGQEVAAVDGVIDVRALFGDVPLGLLVPA